MTWTEGSHPYTVAVRAENAPHRPYFTADWPL